VVRRIQLISLGCSKNRVYSEKLLYNLSNGGVEIVPEETEYAVSKPDAIIINTCGFIESAKQESINEILKAVEAKKRGHAKKVIVCGCLSERYRKELTDSIPEADAFFGTNEWEAILKYLNVLPTDTGRFLTTPQHYAYLQISEGCNRHCSYCAIPLIKGKHKSVAMPKLVEEAKRLAAQGVKELILIAQDTTYYGMDLYKKRKLGELIERLSKIKGIEWIRIHYSYPSGFPEDVLRIMNGNPKVCKYLDIPLQHSSTKVLKMMRRGIDAAGTQKIIDKIREKVPGVALRTTLIVGHPGEGEAEFKELMAFIKRNRFEMMGAFTYSCEENTYDALHYKDSIPQRVKDARYKKLMELQSKISKENNQKRVGGVEKVLIDSYKDGFFLARSQRESPEVDGEIIIKAVATQMPTTLAGKKSSGHASAPNGTLQNVTSFEPQQFIGKFADVKITAAGEYDLTAEFV
jgi:ribosomal protein S12 methylthiotransferase